MSLNQEQRTDNMTFFLDGISWLSLMMDLALLIGIAAFQVSLRDLYCVTLKRYSFSVRWDFYKSVHLFAIRDRM